MRALNVLLAAMLLTASAHSQTFFVQGTFFYEDKQWDYDGWTGVDDLEPIRWADVQALDLDNDVVIGQAATNGDGNFFMVCNAVAPVFDLQILCYSRSTLTSFLPDIEVRNFSGNFYAINTQVFVDQSWNNNLFLAPLVAEPLVSQGHEGSPFNALDMAVAAFLYLIGPEVGLTKPSEVIEIQWRSNLCTCVPGNEPTKVHLRAEDGFDDPVVLHELGHVVHNIYSESDNPGGSHSLSDSDQDPRLSFAEGFATFFAGAVLDDLGHEGLYVDAAGDVDVGGDPIHFKLESAFPYQALAHGAASEVAVTCALYDLVDDQFSIDDNPAPVDDDAFQVSTSILGLTPDRAVMEIMLGPIEAASNSTLNSFWDGWFALFAADSHETELRGVFDPRSLRFWNDAQEPDNSVMEATLLDPDSGWTGEHTLYFSDGVVPAPGSGDEDWYLVPLVKGSVANFETRYPGGNPAVLTQADTYIEVFDPSGELAGLDHSSGEGRNARVANLAIDETGDWQLKVTTLHSYRRYGRYNARVDFTLQNFQPEILDLTADPGEIPDFRATTLTAVATDANPGQALTFDWTPLNGGTITGNGRSMVRFDPPEVFQPTSMTIALVVTDELGATATGAVTVLVTPVGSKIRPGPGRP